MPEVPSSKEFARILRRLDPSDRIRIAKLAHKGKLGNDPAEAALVAAAARREQRWIGWSYILLPFLLAGLTAIDDGRPLSVVIAFVAGFVVGLPFAMLFRRRLVQTERLNRQLAGESP